MTPNSTQNRKRKKLRYNSLDEILKDAGRICRSSHVECLGNWTPGQIFEHLAKSFRSSVHESHAVLPLWRRAIARITKPFLLRYGLPSGVQIESASQVAAEEFLPRDHIPKKEGFSLLTKAVAELSSETMCANHNLFGKMSHKDWQMMHCRHAELHISFLRTKDD